MRLPSSRNPSGPNKTGQAELDAAPTLEGEDEAAKVKRLANEKAAKAAEEERSKSLAEEDKLKAEAARLEELSGMG